MNAQRKSFPLQPNYRPQLTATGETVEDRLVHFYPKPFLQTEHTLTTALAPQRPRPHLPLAAPRGLPTGRVRAPVRVLPQPAMT